MPRPRFTEDVEFRTGLDSNDNLVRRPRFIRRPRVVNGRTVTGNAAYYRRREAELRAARRQQRAALAGARSAARRTRGAERTASNATRAGRNEGNPRTVTPRSTAPTRTRRGGIRGALGRVARGAANALQRRRNRRS